MNLEFFTEMYTKKRDHLLLKEIAGTVDPKEPEYKCPDCTSANVKVWHEQDGQDDYKWVMKCLDCGLLLEE